MKKENFWTKMAENSRKGERPFFCLAPMADITDPAYRQIIAKYGAPDIMWTEMVSCDGMVHEEARDKFLKDLVYSDEERPIIAQIFGSNPDNCRETAKIVKKLGFDGIDINMGCPDKNINKQGAGAGLIRTPELAKEIVMAVKEGAEDIPVSVKTRIGYSKNELEAWLPNLLEAKPVAITIHGRTRKEMSKVPAHWDIIKMGVEIARGSGVLIVGNGDVKNIKEGVARAKETGVDGIMIGRGIFGNPWLFNNNVIKEKLPLFEILKVMLEHSRIFEKLLGGKKSFLVMRKHFGSYIGGFSGARELRIKLMETESADDVERVITPYLK